MKHSEARLLVGADPHATPSPELAEHLAGCPECAQFQREMVALDTNIRRVLEQELLSAAPATAATAITAIAGARLTQRRKSIKAWSGWALAAGIAMVSILAVWALRPNDTIAHDLVVHVQHEPNSWSGTQPVPAASVRETLAHAGVALDMNSDQVMYARTCLFHGHEVPHLVVTTEQGAVTVLVLPDEHVQRRTTFHDDGMSGVITPAVHGSIAVLQPGNQNIDAVAQQVQQSVRWLP